MNTQQEQLKEMELRLSESDDGDVLIKQSKINDNRLLVTFYPEVDWEDAEQHLTNLFGYSPIPCSSAVDDWYVVISKEVQQ